GHHLSVGRQDPQSLVFPVPRGRNRSRGTIFRPRAWMHRREGATDMKRLLLAAALCLTMLTVPAGRAWAAEAEHEAQPPLLPANAEEFKEYTLGPAIWTLVIFVIMLAILYPTAWKNVLAGLKKREERIRKDIADAEATRARAEATLREYNQQLATAENRVREMLGKATADAERLATTIRMQAQQESEDIKERATKDIEAAKNQAIREIYAQ